MIFDRANLYIILYLGVIVGSVYLAKIIRKARKIRKQTNAVLLKWKNLK